MAYPDYVRSKARRLRIDQALTIDEIAARLSIGRTTAHLWVKDLPRPPRASARQGPGQARGTRAMQRKYAAMRRGAYELGMWEYPRMVSAPTFRDFVCLFICEGYKRSRNAVAIANSDAAVMRVAHRWCAEASLNPLRFAVQIHADQREDDVRAYWAEELGIPPAEIALQRKSNSGRLGGRNWRSPYGVLTVRACDTLFRARLQGWVDRLRNEWLESDSHGA